MPDSPLATPPPGYRFAGLKAGIKPSGGLDLAVIVADGPRHAAGTFTTNRVAAAPVRWCRSILPSAGARAVVVNAGNANAATGEVGLANARETARLAADRLGCRPEQVLVASTGIIGHQLPMDRLSAGLGRALDAAEPGAEALDLASRSILTTDTRPKVVSVPIEVGGSSHSLLGLAKGAAMIGPRMATMLAFLVTDAPIGLDRLRRTLAEAVDASFNCVSVEGHASTNDTVLALAAPTPDPEAGAGADDAIRSACVDLARMIADDGEGATRRITIDVEGAPDREAARAIARAVADSPLVKAAIHGADPNWGRIVSAAGYAGVPFDEADVSLALNAVPLYAAGAPLGFDAAAVSASIRSDRDVTIRLTVGAGPGSIRFWTCDLTAEYIRLNADYST